MRNVPQTIVPNILAQETEHAYIILLDIAYGAAEPLRFCNNAVSLDYQANTYSPLPFTITLPTEHEGQQPESSITLDNVSRVLIDDVRSQEQKLVVTVTVVQAEDMETLAVFPEMYARDVRYSVTSLTMVLNWEDFLQESFPEGKFSRSRNPGLF